jgi:hypothetical protein
MRLAKVLSVIPIRPRVAFVLALADRVANVFPSSRTRNEVVGCALKDAWEWVEGKSTSASSLYEAHVGKLCLESSLLKDGPDASALASAISAFYYVLWHAYRQDLNNERVSAGEVPNDMADVSEEIVDEVCQFACDADSSIKDWVETMGPRFVRDFHFGTPDDLGPIVHRDFLAEYGRN